MSDGKSFMQYMSNLSLLLKPEEKSCIIRFNIISFNEGKTMKLKIGLYFRNIAKMSVQNIILPIIYKFEKIRYKGEKKLYVFADAHHTSLPFSLEAMYNKIVSMGIEPVCHFYDYTHEGYVKSLFHAISFMRILAQAKYVFICDNFVPVSACNKDKETKVAQLCHFSGPFKKIGHATNDDVPDYYKGSVYKNYDLVTASSEMFVPILTDAMRQKPGVVQNLGVSRSDLYFDEKWVNECKKTFYEQFPDAYEKKVLLWAPTFRGNAASPNTLDNESMFKLQEKLGDEWLVLIKHHPHDDAMETDPRYRSNCNIPSERLLPCVDLLITDYSTTVLDFLAFDRPFILYAPDLQEYENTRGFFVDYRNITSNLVETAENLDEVVKSVYQKWLDGDRKDIDRCKEMFTKMCDGNATERIIDHLQNL